MLHQDIYSLLRTRGNIRAFRCLSVLLQCFIYRWTSTYFQISRRRKQLYADRLIQSLIHSEIKNSRLLRERPKRYVRQKSQRNNKPLVFFCTFLISRTAVTINHAAADGVAVLSALVAGITLDGVDRAVCYRLNNSNLVG